MDMKRFLKYAFIAFVIVAIAAQFIRPNRENPISDPALSLHADSTIPPNVVATLDRACFDCHSNATRWPWYYAITPVNFLVARDVEQGRARLNFSEWKKYSPERQDSKKGDIAEEVTKGEMPMKIYVMMHSEARLTPEDVKLIAAWSGTSDATGATGKEEKE
jgi:hypothetical protein